MNVCRNAYIVLALSTALASWSITASADDAAHKHADHHGAAKAADEKAHVDATVKAYLAVQELLAQDKIDGVDAQLAKIRASAKAIVDLKEAKGKEHAQAILKAAEAQPKTLKEARGAFKPLSSAVIALVQAVPTSADVPTLYEATCPMAKANWLQSTKDIVNPYMGKEMLDCGEIVRKVEAKQAQ